LIINDVSFDIDFTDADFIEKIETGSKKVYEETEKLKNIDYTLAEGIRQECKILKEFLDYVLGDGTSEKLFGKKDSLHLCLKAFEDIIKKKEEQVKSINELAKRYSPERLER
jgi:hypothetical protein